MRVESKSLRRRDHLFSYKNRWIKDRTLSKVISDKRHFAIIERFLKKVFSELRKRFCSFWKKIPRKNSDLTIGGGIGGIPFFLFHREPWKVIHEKRRTTTGCITRTRTRAATAHRACTPAPVVAPTSTVAASKCNSRSLTRIIGRSIFTWRSPTQSRTPSPRGRNPPRRRC